MNKEKCVVLFSGGTDSCASAFLAAQEYQEVHLITFYEKATLKSPLPYQNIDLLKKYFPRVNFLFQSINIDDYLKKISYENYLKNLIQFHILNLATPGFSSLAWHLKTIEYCKKNKIQTVFDGMTRELQHLPGHMPAVRSIFINLYSRYEITFSSPVYNWPVPMDKQLLDKVIINRHSRLLEKNSVELTTGKFLYNQKFFANEDVKGSALDFEMQHDCYPFIIYNIMLFWIYLVFFDWYKFENSICLLIQKKIYFAEKNLLNA